MEAAKNEGSLGDKFRIAGRSAAAHHQPGRVYTVGNVVGGLLREFRVAFDLNRRQVAFLERQRRGPACPGAEP